MSEPIWAIVGPTASGKSGLALALAEAIEAEIISVDSAQVFVGMDLGTAKPTRQERARVPHHLIDVISPNTQWTAAHFAARADQAIEEIQARGRRVILCGGTGLWYRALIHGVFDAPEIEPALREQVRKDLSERGSSALHAELARIDPDAAAKLHPNDPQRIGRAIEVYRQTGRPISAWQAEHGFRAQRYRVIARALAWPREALWSRLETRTAQMYADGLVEETRRLIEEGADPDGPGLSVIGYRDAVRVVQGEIDAATAEAQTVIATRQYAKRQRNWFNSEPTVEWMDGDRSPADVVEALSAIA